MSVSETTLQAKGRESAKALRPDHAWALRSTAEVMWLRQREHRREEGERAAGDQIRGGLTGFNSKGSGRHGSAYAEGRSPPLFYVSL